MHEPLELDGYDIALLAALQDDGRLTNQELAERVALSPSQCSRRRQRLEQAGIVAGYAARFDPAAIGLAVTAFVQVTLARHSRDNADAFRALLAERAEVLDAWALTGEADYLVRVTTPDLPRFAGFVNEVLLAHQSVARVQSRIVLDCLKSRAPLPLAHLRRTP